MSDGQCILGRRSPGAPHVRRCTSRGVARRRVTSPQASALATKRREFDVLRLRRCDHHVARQRDHDVSLIRIAPRRRTERRSDGDPHTLRIVSVRHALQDMTIQDDDGSLLQLGCGDRTPEREAVGLLMVRHGWSVRPRTPLGYFARCSNACDRRARSGAGRQQRPTTTKPRTMAGLRKAVSRTRRPEAVGRPGPGARRRGAPPTRSRCRPRHPRRPASGPGPSWAG
jgi:hypothetical protein